MKRRSFKEYHLERLKNESEAERYLEIALEEFALEEDVDALMLAFRDVAEAQGGVGKLAKRAKLTRQSVYKMLSAKGNPTLTSLNPLLHGLGYRLAVVPLDEKRK